MSLHMDFFFGRHPLECVLGHPLNIFLLYGQKFMYFFGSLVDLNQKQPLIQILKNMVVAFMHI